MSLWDDVNKSVDDQMEMEELERFCEEREKRYTGDVSNTGSDFGYYSADDTTDYNGWRGTSNYTKKKATRNNRYNSNQYNPIQNNSIEKAYENRLIVITALIILVLSLIYTFFIAR